MIADFMTDEIIHIIFRCFFLLCAGTFLYVLIEYIRNSSAEEIFATFVGIPLFCIIVVGFFGDFLLNMWNY